MLLGYKENENKRVEVHTSAHGEEYVTVEVYDHFMGNSNTTVDGWCCKYAITVEKSVIDLLMGTERG